MSLSMKKQRSRASFAVVLVDMVSMEMEKRNYSSCHFNVNNVSHFVHWKNTHRSRVQDHANTPAANKACSKLN